MQGSSDEALIGRIAAGDRLAMQVLFTRHHVRVYRFVLRLIHDEAAAEDLISDVFLDVWRHAGRFRERSSVSTWLIAIARNKAYTALRKRPHIPIDEQTEATAVSPEMSPETAVQIKDKAAILRECISRLSTEQREIIDLVYYHEMSVEEASRVVGIPENTVKTRMFYARKRLAEMLKVAGVDRGWP